MGFVHWISTVSVLVHWSYYYWFCQDCGTDYIADAFHAGYIFMACSLLPGAARPGAFLLGCSVLQMSFVMSGIIHVCGQNGGQLAKECNDDFKVLHV